MISPHRFAINSVSTGCEALEPTLAAYAEAGFDNVEFQLGHVYDYLDKGHEPSEVRALLDRHGLECIGGFQAIVRCFGDRNQLLEDNDQIIRNAELLGELGADVMVVGTDGPETEDPSDLIASLAARLDRVADAIRSTGITLCVEFNWSPVIRSLWTAAEIVRRCSAENIAVLFDPAHYHCTPTKLRELDAANVETIGHVHVDDMAAIPGDLSDCNADRRLPGNGHLDLRSLFTPIEDHGYTGYYSIELFDDELASRPIEESAKRLFDSLSGLRD